MVRETERQTERQTNNQIDRPTETVLKGDHERAKRDEAVKNRVGGNDDLATAPFLNLNLNVYCSKMRRITHLQ